MSDLNKPYFYFDPEADGFEYFETENERDKAAQDAIQMYLDEGWNEDVTNIVTGTITNKATMVDVEMRPDTVDEDGYDDTGGYWNQYWDYKCDYKIRPLGFVCPTTKALKG